MMEPDVHQLERYIHDALGLHARITPWAATDRLPHYLRELYRYAQMEVLGTPFLIVFDVNLVESTPAAVRKHIDILRSKQNVDVVYVRPQVTAYNRKRLIEQKVPFIVPGNQMYLPMLAIDLREHFRRVRAETPAFSPATQAVVIYALLHDVKDEISPLEMARSLGYTPMTMTRAFDEIEAARVAVVTVRGRERRLHFPPPRQETWAKAQPFLRSPVKQRLLVPSGMPVTELTPVSPPSRTIPCWPHQRVLRWRSAESSGRMLAIATGWLSCPRVTLMLRKHRCGAILRRSWRGRTL